MSGTPRLAILLAAAMFVFVIDTSLMNVSISAVVRDLDTTVSGVQAAVAIEALVSAAFILIGSKVGDLFGRKRAYVAGLILYAVGALAMVVGQGLAAIIVFWAVIGGLGASLYLPAMQSLIHGNFEGKMQAKVYALVGASAAIAAAIGPLLGGFLTTLLSWRVGFLLEALIIAGVLSGSGMIRDVPYKGDRSVDLVGALFSIAGMGGLVLGVLAWQEGAESVAALLALGLAGIGALIYWLVRRKREGKPTLLDPSLFSSKLFSFGIAQGILQQIALGGILIALPIYLQLVLGYNALEAGLSLAPVSLTMFGVALLAGRRAGVAARRPDPDGVPAGRRGDADPDPDRAERRHRLAVGDPLGDHGSRVRPPGLAAQQLHAVPRLRREGRRGGRRHSATGSFGLSFGLAFAGAVMLAALSIAFTDKSDSSTVLPPADKQHVADVLEDDAQVMSDAQLEELLADQPEAIQDEIISINTDARHLALQVALLVTLVSALIGLVNAFRMMPLPDPQPSSASVA